MKQAAREYFSFIVMITLLLVGFSGNSYASSVTTSGSATAYTPGGGVVTVDPSITASGSCTVGDKPDATVEISTGFQSGDVLSGDGGSWDSSKGILTITDATDWPNLQSKLCSVTFDTTSGDTSDRVIAFTVGCNLGGALLYNDHYYEFVTDSGIYWTAAKTAAEGMTLAGLNGYLATVTSAGENAFIQSKLDGQGWMGASDCSEESEWSWKTGPEKTPLFLTRSRAMPLTTITITGLQVSRTSMEAGRIMHIIM